MAEVTPKSNVLIMANGDTYTPNGRRIKIEGVRLVAASGATATATITSTSDSKIIYSMSCPANYADESGIETQIDTTSITAAVVGAGATLYVYLK